MGGDIYTQTVLANVRADMAGATIADDPTMAQLYRYAQIADVKASTWFRGLAGQTLFSAFPN